MASPSTFALDFLRRLLCANSAGNAGDRPAATRGAAAVCHMATPETDSPRSPSPCIVARLMGLDAMPAEAPYAQPQPQPTPPLRRSRSASSAEGSPSPWDPDAQQQPRVVRVSSSLRERPGYLRQESDEFLLLSFSPEDRDRERDDVKEELDFLLAAEEAARRGGSVRSDAAAKQRRSARCRRLRFADDEAESESGSAGRVLRVLRTRTPAAECDAQNSSPVSVLEARHAQDESSTTTTTSSSLEDLEPCSATSDEAQTSCEQKNSTRKMHADFNQLANLSPARSSCHVSRCSDRERGNRRVVNKAEVITPEVSGIWHPICRLVEEDLKNMEWPTRDGADFVAEESGILDHLICEMMKELLQGMSETVHRCPFQSISKKQLSGKNVQIRRAI